MILKPLQYWSGFFYTFIFYENHTLAYHMARLTGRVNFMQNFKEYQH